MVQYASVLSTKYIMSTLHRGGSRKYRGGEHISILMCIHISKADDVTFVVI